MNLNKRKKLYRLNLKKQEANKAEKVVQVVPAVAKEEVVVETVQSESVVVEEAAEVMPVVVEEVVKEEVVEVVEKKKSTKFKKLVEPETPSDV